MPVIRKAHRNHIVFWLLATVIAMRSLIAPGFMLDVDNDSPLGINISFCGGWNNNLQPDLMDDPHAIHNNSDANQHDHDAEYELTGSACEIWSSSTTFVETKLLYLDHLLELGTDNFQNRYKVFHYSVSFLNPQQPRAPPVSKHI
jgi:hypothetical protein